DLVAPGDHDRLRGLAEVLAPGDVDQAEGAGELELAAGVDTQPGAPQVAAEEDQIAQQVGARGVGIERGEFRRRRADEAFSSASHAPSTSQATRRGPAARPPGA